MILKKPVELVTGTEAQQPANLRLREVAGMVGLNGEAPRAWRARIVPAGSQLSGDGRSSGRSRVISIDDLAGSFFIIKHGGAGLDAWGFLAADERGFTRMVG